MMLVHQHIQNITNMLLHGQSMAIQRSEWESFENMEIDAIETEIDSIERRYRFDFIGFFLIQIIFVSSYQIAKYYIAQHIGGPNQKKEGVL